MGPVLTSTPLSRSTSSLPGDNPPAEKKYKPLNTTPNATKEIKVKIIPPQREWGTKRGRALRGDPPRSFWDNNVLIFSPFFLFFSAMEGLGFLDALNSAPIPGIKIKKKKKVLSPTAAKVRRFWGGYKPKDL